MVTSTTLRGYRILSDNLAGAGVRVPKGTTVKILRNYGILKLIEFEHPFEGTLRAETFTPFRLLPPEPDEWGPEDGS